jgi:nitrate reductase NapE component
MRWLRVIAVALPGLLLAGFGVQHPSGLTPETAHHWWTMHVLLIPVFPLLAVALLWLLSGERGVLPWVARISGYGFATCYTALDVLSGIGAGLVVENDGRPSQNMLNLFAVGDRIGLAGVWMLMACVVSVTLVLGLRHGPRVLPGGVLLLAGCWVFRTSHIFYPYGVAAMVALAVGTALLALAAPVPGRGERERVLVAEP